MQADKFATQILGSFWSKHRFKLLGVFLFFVVIVALNYLLELTFFTQEAAKIERLGERPIVEGAKFVNIDSPQFVNIEEHIDLSTPPTPKPEIVTQCFINFPMKFLKLVENSVTLLPPARLGCVL